MRIGLAQSRFPKSISDGTSIVEQMIEEASQNNCDIVCFPESIIPGLRGVGYAVETYNHECINAALQAISNYAREVGTAVILPMEWQDKHGRHLVAFVISKKGEIMGYQTKNQIDPEEDKYGYVPGTGRQMFEVNNVRFGIVICHEGWRYPETVRWAASRGATIVFHPQFTGNVMNPEFYNGAMLCRSLENNIYFASINYALEEQQCLTTLVSPAGERLCIAPKGAEKLMVYDIDPSHASRELAKRFNPLLL